MVLDWSTDWDFDDDSWIAENQGVGTAGAYLMIVICMLSQDQVAFCSIHLCDDISALFPS